MSLSELSSCLPATPIFSYRVTATLSIRSDTRSRRGNGLNDSRTSLIKKTVGISYQNDISIYVNIVISSKKYH